MPSSCVAYGCFEKAGASSTVTFHSFPKDEFRRRIWEVKLRRKNFKASNSSKICSKHFAPDCFDTEKFGGTWLKKTAVPTIFDFSGNVQKKKKERKPPVKKTLEETLLVTDNKTSRKQETIVPNFCQMSKSTMIDPDKIVLVAQVVEKKLTNIDINGLQKPETVKSIQQMDREKVSSLPSDAYVIFKEYYLKYEPASQEENNLIKPLLSRES